MAARALVVIWTLASELSSPGTVAMRNATHDALGPDSVVRAEPLPDTDSPPPQALKASGVVRVTWDEGEHRRARVSCYLPALDRWVEREVVFAPSDPEFERGRTLGFLVASIFIDAGVVERAPEPVREKERPVMTAAPKSSSEPPQAVSASSDSDSKAALGAAAQIAGPGAATGFGAWLGLERQLRGSTLWIGGAGQARFGSIPEAQASSRFLALGLQATWLAWLPSPKSWLGIRGSASVAQLSVAHLSDDDAGEPDRQSRLLAAFELVLHTGYQFSTASALAGDVGAEFLSGKTAIWVHQRQVAAWPQFVPVLRLGVKSTF